MNKRTLERLRRILMRSRLEELAAWYAAHKPEVTSAAIGPDLAEALETNPDEAAELGVTPMGGTRCRFIYAPKGAAHPMLLYPHG